ncbi:hypothetical protein [Paraburkholderia xenovorans]
MQQKLDGATRLFHIIGDPIEFVKSPRQLTLGFEAPRPQRRLPAHAGT